jgi:preprotein translocase subunit SecY
MNSEYPSSPTNKPLPTPNPFTQASHRREVKRQVVLPLGITLFIFISVVTWLAWAGVGTVERWSQIAVIFMLMIGLVLGLIFLSVIIGLFYLITMILRTIPPYARMAQDAISKINQQVQTGSNVSVRPVIEIQKFLAMVDVLLGRRKV